MGGQVGGKVGGQEESDEMILDILEENEGSHLIRLNGINWVI